MPFIVDIEHFWRGDLSLTKRKDLGRRYIARSEWYGGRHGPQGISERMEATICDGEWVGGEKQLSALHVS